MAVLARFREFKAPITDLPEGPDDSQRNTYDQRIGWYSKGQGFVQKQQVRRENIERRLANATKKDLPDYQMYGDLAALSDEAFENTAEIFEDVLWKNNKEDFRTGNLPLAARKYFSDPPATHRRADQYPPSDIFILYGDITNAAANHTIKKLINVSILGQGQVIMVGGEPIREQYRFIAQNLA